MKTDASQKAREVQARLVESVRGERLYLRGVEDSDLEDRVRWANDPVIQRTLNFEYPLSVARARAWLHAITADMTRRDLVIVSCRDDKPVGFGGFLNIDLKVRKAELYIAIGEKAYWGSGYGREGYELLTRYGFLELGLNKIYGYQLTFNTPATRQVENLGWKVDGVLRQDILSHGEMKDRLVVSILKSEWDQIKSGANDSNIEPAG